MLYFIMHCQFFKVAVKFYTAPTKCKGFNCSSCLTVFAVDSLNFSYSNACKVYGSVVLLCCALMMVDKQCFIFLLAICFMHFYAVSVQIFAHAFVSLSFYYWYVGTSVILWMYVLCQIHMHFECFLQVWLVL